MLHLTVFKALLIVLLSVKINGDECHTVLNEPGAVKQKLQICLQKNRECDLYVKLRFCGEHVTNEYEVSLGGERKRCHFKFPTRRFASGLHRYLLIGVSVKGSFRCSRSFLTKVEIEEHRIVYEIICPSTCPINPSFYQNVTVTKRYCIPSWFGTFCDQKCLCGGKKCSPKYGNCYHKRCPPGFRGVGCDHICLPGTFGYQCQKKCRCKDNEVCNRTTGACLKGCPNGYKGKDCQTVCVPGTFGYQCQKKCRCKDNEVCNRATGACLNGCANGYKGIDCQTVCVPGTFGYQCQKKCHCKGNAVCDRTTGACPNGCLTGYKGIDCQTVCVPGTFGYQCQKKCHCKGNAVCDRTTGACPNGCPNGYKGTDCQTVCVPGTFGYQCQKKCHCKDNEVCNRTTGACPNGCPNGYKGTDCQNECDSGTWGRECKGKCHCKNDVSCDSKSGVCPNKECSIRFSGDACQKTCPNDSTFYGESGECDGVCHCRDSSKCRVTNGECVPGGCAAGYHGKYCQNASIVTVTEGEKEEPTISESTNLLPTIICVILAAVLLLAGIGYIIYRKRKTTEIKRQTELTQLVAERYSEFQVSDKPTSSDASDYSDIQKKPDVNLKTKKHGKTTERQELSDVGSETSSSKLSSEKLHSRDTAMQKKRNVKRKPKKDKKKPENEVSEKVPELSFTSQSSKKDASAVADVQQKQDAKQDTETQKQQQNAKSPSGMTIIVYKPSAQSQSRENNTVR